MIVLENNGDLFGNSGSSFGGSNGFNAPSTSNFQGGGFGNNPQGFEFKKTPEPPKRSYKKLFIGLGVLATLALASGGTYMVIKHNQRVAQEKKAKEEAMKTLEEQLQTSIPHFALAEISDTSNHDGVSLWDLNLTHVSTNTARTDFAAAVARSITANLSGDTIRYQSPNWDYVAWVIKHVDHDKVKELTKDLKKESYTYKDDLIDAFSKYISANLADMLAYKNSYVAAYMQGTDVPKSLVDNEVNGVVVDGKLTEDFAIALDKSTFSAESLHKAEDMFVGVAEDTFGEKHESKAHEDWAGREKELTSYINSLRSYLGLTARTVEQSKKSATGEIEKVEVANPNSFDKLNNPTYDSAVSAWLELKKVEPSPYTYSNADKNLDKVVYYSWIGTGYISSKDSDAKTTNVHIGTGKYEDPVTFGTPFVTKMQGTDGNYHDVRVTVMKVLVADDAIKDVQTYNDKNKGFTSVSELVLGVVKFQVENLEESEVELNSEFTLADSEQNLVTRTGTVYNIPERAKIPARGTVEMADWFNTKETKTLNLMWGKTFNHQQPAIFVNALGDEIYDQYARKIERNTKKVVENKAQADQKALERLAKEEIEARKKAQLEGDE